MPEQNQPIQGAFGDIYRVETPTLDRVAQQLQQQYAARQAYQQKESEHTDQLVNKELANVRSIDMSGVIDSYSKWKQLKQNILFNKSLQQNPKAYNTAQMEANAAYADVATKINKSAQLNQFGKQLYTERNTPGKSNLYSDDFGDKASAFWSTPMDQLGNHKFGDLSNPDTYRYKGSATNFGDLEKKASGTPAQRYQKEEQVSPLQKNITPYTFGNLPAQFQQTLRGEFASSKQANRDAAMAWDAVPQTEKDRVDQAYSQIPAERWQQMGLSSPQAIAPTNPNDPADNYAAYRAKLYAINNIPAAGKVYSNIDQGAKMKANFSHRELMEAIREGNREKLVSLRHQYKQLDVKEQSQVLDDTVNDILNDSKKEGVHSYRVKEGGDISKEYKLKVSGTLQKALSIQDPDDVKHRIDADDLLFDEQKNTVTPIFYQKGKPHTLENIDKAYSKPMTMGEFKAIVGKTYFGVREAAKESSGSTTKPTSSGIKWQ